MSTSDPNSFAASMPGRGGIVGGKPSLVPAQLVDHLYGGRAWSAYGAPATVTYGFRRSARDDAGVSGFQLFSNQQIGAAEEALQSWADVANIRFVRVRDTGVYTDNATILFGNYTVGEQDSAGFAYYPGEAAATSLSGDVWLNARYSQSYYPNLLSYGMQVMAHEIGHAIGLSHPSRYDNEGSASFTYAADASYYEDDRRHTIMSYFSERETGGDNRGYYSSVPLLDDIYAIQQIYGANLQTRTGDTVYGFNSNAGRDWFSTVRSTYMIFAAWDAGGIDTFDFSGYYQDQTIDLREGAFSNVGGLIGNVSIAYGTVIERAIGGTGSDTIIGNAAANRLTGGSGNDRLYGENGDDQLFGGAGDDMLDGGSGINRIDGGDGTDTLLLAGAVSDWEAVADARGGWTISRNGIFNQVTGIERVALGDPAAGTTQTTYGFAAFTSAAFAGLRYIASYGDLIAAFGMNGAAGRQHYEAAGRAEGRTITFDPLRYAASNPDLARAYGMNAVGLETHYITTGVREGRATASFDPMVYAASNPDLARIFGANDIALAQHYITFGLAEGRSTASFDPLGYAASNLDVFRALGTSTSALAAHYVGYGLAEGRTTTGFDTLGYAASNSDVARALGTNRLALENHYLAAGLTEVRTTSGFDYLSYAFANPDLLAAYGLDRQALALHYVNFGIAEGRTLGRFNPYVYAASNPDVARGVGLDPMALAAHYRTYGMAEGRSTDRFDPVAYGVANPDVAKVIGFDTNMLAVHYVQYGMAEQRLTSGFDALLYAASNPDLIRSIGNDPATLARHYLLYGAREGRSLDGFDPLRYLASNPDLIGVLGTDRDTLIGHFVRSGALEGRSATSFDPVAYLLSHPEAQGTGVSGALRYYLSGGFRAGGNPNGAFGSEQADHAIVTPVVSSFETVGDRDWYVFQIRTPGYIYARLFGGAEDLAVSRTNLDTILSLYDANGRLVDQNDNYFTDAATPASSALSTYVTAGQYYLVAGTSGDRYAGQYGISLQGSGVARSVFAAEDGAASHDAGLAADHLPTLAETLSTDPLMIAST